MPVLSESIRLSSIKDIDGPQNDLMKVSIEKFSFNSPPPDKKALFSSFAEKLHFPKSQLHTSGNLRFTTPLISVFSLKRLSF